MTKKNIQYGLPGMGRTMTLQAQGRRGFDGVVGLGRMTALRASTMVGNDGAEAPGRTRRRRGGSEEGDDGAGCREIFGGKFLQPDSMRESHWGLVFAKVTQWFIYRGTTIATGICDVIRAVATENHSSNGPLPSSDCCKCDPYIYCAILM
jgi:hypothetical protein